MNILRIGFAFDLNVDPCLRYAFVSLAMSLQHFDLMEVQSFCRFRVLSSSGSRDFDVQTTHQR